MSEKQEHHPGLYARRVWMAAGIGSATLILLVVVVFGIQILLMLFAGLLFALALSIPAHWLCRHSFLSERWALLVVLLALLALGGTFGYWCSTRLMIEIHQLSRTLPDAFESFRQQLSQWPITSPIMDHASSALSGQAGPSGMLSRLSTFLASTSGLLLNLIVIVFVGLYVAVEPLTYRNGLLRLFPTTRRDDAARLLDVIRHWLSWWILGQLVSMTVVGTLTWLGLWILGAPTAFTLGLLAGLLELIPNFGPIISVVPALLLGFSQSPETALYVLVLYLLIQLVESYGITPMVQRQAVEIPPGLLIMVQVALGLWAGFMGLLVAAPLTAMTLVIVKQCYIKGWLGECDDKKT